MIKKFNKLIFSAAFLLVSGTMLFGSDQNIHLQVTSYAESTDYVSGKCGENAEYKYYDDERLLVISGSGTINKIDPVYRTLVRKIIIGSGITEIPAQFFNGSVSLQEVYIPDSVIKIRGLAFTNCINLNTVRFSENAYAIFINAFNNTGWYNNQPDGPVYAGNNFYCYKGYDDSVKSISFREGTVGICNEALKNCNGISEIIIPKSVKHIGASAFEGTEWYDDQPDGLVYIDDILYNYKGEVPQNSELVIKDGTRAFSDNAFYNKIPKINSLVIPESVNYLGRYSLWGCNIDELTIENKDIEIENELFEPKPYKNIIYGDFDSAAHRFASEKNIRFACGKAKSGVFTYNIMDGCVEICEISPGTEKMRTLNIPETLAGYPVIGYYGDFITEYETINIPAGIKYMKYSEYERFPVKGTKKKYGVTMTNGVYKYQGSECIVDPDNTVYTSFNGGVYTKNMRKLLFQGWGYGINIIPEGVMVLGRDSLEGNEPVEIRLPSTYLGEDFISVLNPDPQLKIYGYDNDNTKNMAENHNKEYISIGESETDSQIIDENGILVRGGNCNGEVTINDSVKVIGECAFWENNNITSVVIPDGVTEIQAYAFQNCYELRKIVIPPSVTKIDESAFDGTISIRLAIWGEKNSYAEKYALNNNRTFREMNFFNASDVKLFGDVNDDLKIDVQDFLLLNKKVLGADIDSGSKFNEVSADLNGDSKINIFDVMRLQKTLISVND